MHTPSSLHDPSITKNMLIISSLTTQQMHKPSSSSPSSSSSFSSSISSSRHHFLFRVATLIQNSDLLSAQRLLLSSPSPTPSLSSDSLDRLLHQFSLALSLRLSLSLSYTPPPPPPPPPFLTSSFSSSQLQSSYLSLNQITPFLRFSHLTANQAILDSIVSSSSPLHILDFDSLHGLQWPPLLQAIADRFHPPPPIRITGSGSDLSVLRKTQSRLESFAASLGLSFQFQPLQLFNATTVQLHPGETLAVNCVMFLNKLIKDPDGSDADGTGEVKSFLRAVKSMNPCVVTVAEREAAFNSPVFLQRFMEALDHYTAVFDSLEATVAPASRERLEVEQIWFGREIADVVAGEGEMRRERSVRFEKWEEMMASVGFESRALSGFAVSQARFLLRLHYPSEGYQLKIGSEHCLFLGWQNKPLFSVSSWH